MCADVFDPRQLRQPKRGFVLPIAKWLRTSLRETMEENLDWLRGCGVLERAGIDMIAEMFRREPDSPAWSRVWALVALGSWMRRGRESAQAAAVAGRSA